MNVDDLRSGIEQLMGLPARQRRDIIIRTRRGQVKILTAGMGWVLAMDQGDTKLRTGWGRKLRIHDQWRTSGHVVIELGEEPEPGAFAIKGFFALSLADVVDIIQSEAAA